MKRINVLTVAGSDPSGGAGIQADLKTFSALKAYGCSVITTLVAQNTCGVQSIYHIEPNFISAQLDSVLSDIQIDSIKIGMLPEESIVEAVIEQLKRYQIKNIILDTVMLAKSGDSLISPTAIKVIRKKLLPIVSIITLNLLESAILLESSIALNEADMKIQCRELLSLGCYSVLMKGGHLNSSEIPDWFLSRKEEQRFSSPRILTKNIHGTGCTLSAAIAALYPRYNDWIETIQNAKDWFNLALAKSNQFKIGKGNNPIHHFYEWW